jgi:pimeloyl-ACP methyl ester carboxylesterase
VASGTGISTGGIEAGAGSRRRWGRRWGRRWWLVVLGVVVLLLAGLFGGAGWYYAGQIADEALAVHVPDGVVAHDLEVVAVDGGTVVLRRTGDPVPHDPLRAAEVVGLRWSTGRGFLSGQPVVRDDGVARTLHVTRGVAPGPGTGAGLAQGVWDDPTEAYGVSYVEIAYPCLDAECPAWFVAGTSDTWFIAVHGKGADLTEPLRALGPAIAADMPVLDIGYRNDAAAPRDPSGRYGYGTTEWRDLDAAVAHAVQHGARHVVLFGSSMGGAVVAAFLQHSRSASLVSGVVLDAPALDLRAAVDLGGAQRSLPGVLTRTAEELAALRYDLDWDELDYTGGDWLHVPALVFHGTADATVPIATSEELARARPDLVDLERFAGATHVESWNADPGRYTTAEAAFLDCVSAGPPAGSC